MLVLSARVHEKIVFPGFQTSVQVVSVNSGAVRLGIEAPEEVRALREQLPDRVAEWGPAPAEEDAPLTPVRLDQLIARRLEIAGRGLSELRNHLSSGRSEDAALVLDKLDEDLHLLRRRVRRETEQAPFQAPRARGAMPEFAVLSD